MRSRNKPTSEELFACAVCVILAIIAIAWGHAW